MSVELKLEVWDSPELGRRRRSTRSAARRSPSTAASGGPLIGPSAYFMKSPPVQFSDEACARDGRGVHPRQRRTRRRPTGPRSSTSSPPARPHSTRSGGCPQPPFSAHGTRRGSRAAGARVPRLPVPARPGGCCRSSPTGCSRRCWSRSSCSWRPTEQSTAAGLARATAILVVPYSVVGPFAGVLIDRWSRRLILRYTPAGPGRGGPGDPAALRREPGPVRVRARGHLAEPLLPGHGERLAALGRRRGRTARRQLDGRGGRDGHDVPGVRRGDPARRPVGADSC